MNIEKSTIIGLKLSFLKYVAKILYHILNNYFKSYNALTNLYILLCLLSLISKSINYIT